MQPLVTIAIPTYNRKKYLREALDSAVSQDYPNLEIFVSDNNSDDGTEAMMQDYMREHPQANIRYERREKNYGGEVNASNCLNQAGGEYLVFLCDDDILEPEAITQMVKGMEDDVTCVIGNILIIDADGREMKSHANPVGKMDEQSFWYNKFANGKISSPLSAAMCRTQLAQDFFPTARKCGSANDLAWQLLFSTKGKIHCIPHTTLRYRIHAGNDTNNSYHIASSHVDFFKVFEERQISGQQKQWLCEYCVHYILVLSDTAYGQTHDFSSMLCILKLLNWRNFYLLRAPLLIGRKENGHYVFFYKSVISICNAAITAFKEQHDLCAMASVVNLLNWKNFRMPLLFGWLYFIAFFCRRVIKKSIKILRSKL